MTGALQHFFRCGPRISSSPCSVIPNEHGWLLATASLPPFGAVCSCGRMVWTGAASKDGPPYVPIEVAREFGLPIWAKWPRMSWPIDSIPDPAPLRVDRDFPVNQTMPGLTRLTQEALDEALCGKPLDSTEPRLRCCEPVRHIGPCSHRNVTHPVDCGCEACWWP